MKERILKNFENDVRESILRNNPDFEKTNKINHINIAFDQEDFKQLWDGDSHLYITYSNKQNIYYNSGDIIIFAVDYSEKNYLLLAVRVEDIKHDILVAPNLAVLSVMPFMSFPVDAPCFQKCMNIKDAKEYLEKYYELTSDDRKKFEELENLVGSLQSEIAYAEDCNKKYEVLLKDRDEEILELKECLKMFDKNIQAEFPLGYEVEKSGTKIQISYDTFAGIQRLKASAEKKRDKLNAVIAAVGGLIDPYFNADNCRLLPNMVNKLKIDLDMRNKDLINAINYLRSNNKELENLSPSTKALMEESLENKEEILDHEEVIHKFEN